MEQLPTTILGRTGLKVTRLGIGGAYAKTPDDYRQALDYGLTYLDTGHAYGEGKDEKLVGEAIAGRRHEIVLATKSGARDAGEARAELESSLQLLGTDYVDVWHMHYVNKEEELARILGPGGAMAAAVKAKEQGLVRFIGVTGHHWPVVAQAVETGLFDTVLCWYNCAMPEPESSVFPAAAAHGTGVVIMNATRIDKLVGEDEALPLPGFYRYVLSHPTVNVVLRGLRSPVERVGQVAQALTERVDLTLDERRRYEAYGNGLRAAGKLEL